MVVALMQPEACIPHETLLTMTAAPQKDTAERLHSLRIVRAADTSPKRRRRWVTRLAIAVIPLGAAVALIWPTVELPRFFARMNSQEASKAAPLVAAQPKTQPAVVAESAPAPAQLTLAGYLVARRSVEVAAEVPSVITGLHVDEGDRVSADQLIAELDGSQAAAAFAIAEAKANAADWSIDVLQAEFAEVDAARQRTRSLFDRGLSSQATMDSAEATALALASRLSEAIAKRDIAILEAERAGLLLEKYSVTAPIAGTVTGCAAQVGETVSPGDFDDVGSGGICTIVDFNSIVIEIDVPEMMIHRVQPGAFAIATLEAYPDDPLVTVVDSIAPIANRAKSTIKARLKFTGPEDSRLRPNMAVTVRLKEQ